MADQTTDGMTRVSWLTTLTSTTTPSAAEITSGVALESFITPDGLGIELGDDAVDTSALNSTFTSQKAGRGTVAIEITMKDQGRGVAPWDTFDNRPVGFLVVRRNVLATTAFASGNFVEVYTAKAGDRKPIAPAPNEASKFAIQLFSSTDPELHATAAA